MRSTIVLFLILTSALLTEGQSPAGRLEVKLANGTTGGPGEAESATLFKLASGMQSIAELGHVSGEFTIEDIELDGERFLLQITSGGANYHQMVDFGAGNQIEIPVTVFDVTRDRNELEVKSARYLLRRDGDRLRVEKLYVVENKTQPRKTFYDHTGTFRFHVPQNILGSSSVYVSSTSGTPMPQSYSPLPDGSGYVTWPALKPGPTDITVTFDVDFSSGAYQLQEQAFYDLEQLLVLVTPADIELQGEGWEDLTANPDSRYLVLRQPQVASGAPIELTLAGGSERMAPAPAVAATGGASPHGQITQLPDPSRSQRWAIIALMTAALACGLLVDLFRGTRGLGKVATRRSDLSGEAVPEDAPASSHT